MKPVLIYSMNVSVDGFIADREGAFGWAAPSEELFRFHTALVREVGGYLCGRQEVADVQPVLMTGAAGFEPATSRVLSRRDALRTVAERRVMPAKEVHRDAHRVDQQGFMGA